MPDCNSCKEINNNFLREDLLAPLVLHRLSDIVKCDTMLFHPYTRFNFQEQSLSLPRKIYVLKVHLQSGITLQSRCENEKDFA